ncbi:MAG TPA: Maf family protein [Chthoniobacteraceae bacterium]|nr:Maf family protein [Chthoniobacteraceae bacterium]
MVGQRPLILASASPRRRDLLRERGLPFVVIPAHSEETVEATPEATVIGNARRKARTISEQRPEALVLGVDTEVWFSGRIFGKPADMDDAFRMLKALNGQTHDVYSGVCLAWNGGLSEKTFVEVTHVRFHSHSDEELRQYLRRIGPLDKAGAYAAQDDHGEMIAEVRGSYSNVIGLPMEALDSALQEL